MQDQNFLFEVAPIETPGDWLRMLLIPQSARGGTAPQFILIPKTMSSEALDLILSGDTNGNGDRFITCGVNHDNPNEMVMYASDPSNDAKHLLPNAHLERWTSTRIPGNLLISYNSDETAEDIGIPLEETIESITEILKHAEIETIKWE